jgi:hypothetical protein
MATTKKATKKKATKKGGKKTKGKLQKPKRRIRRHVIASLSLNHVSRYVLRVGDVVNLINGNDDYGYDMFVQTHDPKGYLQPGTYWIQLKATDSIKINAKEVVFKLEVSDLITWRYHGDFVFVIVYDAKKDVAYWLDIQGYLKSKAIDPKGLAQAKLTVRMDVASVVDNKATRTWRRMKNVRLRQVAKAFP